ncbi:hypothetical protein J4221_06230 [Candidatus Pacearchaeota archaeon]|nr:hypothetical protein [Candidatus Pacearchaeota archaeon]
MQEIYVENIKEVLRNKKRIETELEIKLSNKGKNVFINGKPENEFLALHVLEAVNAGFSVANSLQLKDENIILNTIFIKDITKRNDLEIVRGRIIGREGSTLKTLKHLTHCDFAMKVNTVGIIGDAEEIEDAVQAIKSLIQGSRQGRVYGRLERMRKERKSHDRH